MIGESLLHYRLLAKIGEGGMGVVYRALDTRLQRTVALKVLPPETSADSKRRERFLREARAAAALNHPNIISIFEIGVDRGIDFIAMEFVDGESLATIMRRGLLPLELVVDYCTHIASALAKAHASGVVHRDLKPGNVVISGEGQVKLLDFGLAQMTPFSSGSAEPTSELRTETKLSHTGEIHGTFAYMSPEQARGELLDGRSDIFSFGVMLYEMLSGVRPFHADNTLEQLHKTLFAKPIEVNTIRPDTPAALVTVMDRCLEKDREARMGSMEQVVVALRNVSRPAGSSQSRAGSVLAERLMSGQGAPQEQSTVAAMAPLAAATIAADTLTADTTKKRAWKPAAAVFGAALLAFGGWTFFNRLKPATQTTIAEQPVARQLLAVLPFQPINDDPELRALSDGLAEVLTSKLTQLEQLNGTLSVVPASEVRAQKIDSVDRARKQYGVNLAFTGSIQRIGKSIQVTANLVDAVQVRQLRATTFDVAQNDLKALRDGMIGNVIGLLELQLSPQAEQTLANRETDKAQAYFAYVEGRGYLHRFDVEGNLDRAVASLEKAIKEDPNYGLAYGALGEALWRKARLANDKQLAAKALEAAEKAVKLSGNLAGPHVKLGEILGQSARPKDAIAEFNLALGAQPGNSEAYRGLGRTYASIGLNKEAEAAYLQAIRLRPTDWYGYNLLGVFHFSNGDYDKAEAMFLRSRDLTPDNDYPYRNLGMTYAAIGKLEEARNQFQRSIQIKPSFLAHLGLGYLHYLGGRFPQSVSENQLALQFEPGNHLGWGNLGDAFRQMQGKENEAQQAYGKAIASCQSQLEVAPNDPETLAYLATYQAKTGDRAKALENLGRIPDMQALDQSTRFAVAIGHEVLQDRALAIKELTALLALRFSANVVAAEPFLKQINQDPEFARILQKSKRL